MNGAAHFVDDVVAAQSEFGAERHLFEQLPGGADGGDAQVGAAEVDSDGEIGHGGEVIRTAEDVLIVD